MKDPHIHVERTPVIGFGNQAMRELIVSANRARTGHAQDSRHRLREAATLRDDVDGAGDGHMPGLSRLGSRTVPDRGASWPGRRANTGPCPRPGETVGIGSGILSDSR